MDNYSIHRIWASTHLILNFIIYFSHFQYKLPSICYLLLNGGKSRLQLGLIKFYLVILNTCCILLLQELIWKFILDWFVVILGGLDSAMLMSFQINRNDIWIVGAFQPGKGFIHFPSKLNFGLHHISYLTLATDYYHW